MRARFGEFTFDSDTRELRAGAEGRRLSKKAFQLLEILIAHAPNALRKEQLYDTIWGDTFVEEVNLSNLVSEVRGALGETRKSARFIKTIHGYGYAFAGELILEQGGATGARRHQYALYWRTDEYPLKHGENVVGRDTTADVVIDSAAVSRRHARIVVSNTGATIEDLGSKNGTTVRGERATCPAALNDRDEVRLGVVELTFRVISNGVTTVSVVADRPVDS